MLYVLHDLSSPTFNVPLTTTPLLTSLEPLTPACTSDMSAYHQQQLKDLILNMLKPMGSREQPSQVLRKVEELMINVGCTTSKAKADLLPWGVYRSF